MGGPDFILKHDTTDPSTMHDRCSLKICCHGDCFISSSVKGGVSSFPFPL